MTALAAAAQALLARGSVRRALSALAMEGEETRLVGGCVRDALLGRPVSDIDLATTLLPKAVMALAASAGLKAIPTGIDHGTVTILADGEPFEATTLREDIETDGRHAVVRFGRDFRRDAERRDFTINALSLGADGALHDTTNGVSDLEAGRVRFIGDAGARIREDSLRILRFFRFHARYGDGAPDPEGLAACVRARAALDGLSRERVRAELLKLLAAAGAAEAVATLSETGLLARIIAGIGDVGRLRRARDASTQWDGVERLAALAVVSAEDADRLRAALRLSKAEHARLAAYAEALADLRGRAAVEAGAARALAATHGVRALALAVSATRGEPRPRMSGEADEVVGRMLAGAEPAPAFALTGADLVARGVRPGPEIGRRLLVARASWLELGCPEGDAAREALIARALG